MSSKVSSRTNTDPASCQEFQIFDNDFHQLTSDVLKFERYNLLQITNLSQDCKTSEELCLDWLSTQFPLQNWRKDSGLFNKLSNKRGFCALLVKKCQKPDILLFTDKYENDCALIMEIISKSQPKVSFFHLVASLSDMCRVYDQPSMTGYLLPSIEFHYPVVQVKVIFNGLLYQTRQEVLAVDDVNIRVSISCREMLSKDLKSSKPIGVIPPSHLDKYNVIHSTICTIEEDLSFLNKDVLLSTLKECAENLELVSFLSSGWNIVLSLAKRFVIKFPAREKDVTNLKFAVFALKFGTVAASDYSSYAVLPVWHEYMNVTGSPKRLFVAIFEYFETADITSKNICECIVALFKSVKYIHSKEIAHRDIRKANVLFVEQEQSYSAKIIDFDRCSAADNAFSRDWKDVRQLIIVLLICALSRLQNTCPDPQKKEQLGRYIDALQRGKEVEGNKRPFLEESEPSEIAEILQNDDMRRLCAGGPSAKSLRYDDPDVFMTSNFGEVISIIRRFLDSLILA